jgi:hypothetical protein
MLRWLAVDDLGRRCNTLESAQLRLVVLLGHVDPLAELLFIPDSSMVCIRITLVRCCCCLLPLLQCLVSLVC